MNANTRQLDYIGEERRKMRLASIAQKRYASMMLDLGVHALTGLEIACRLTALNQMELEA